MCTTDYNEIALEITISDEHVLCDEHALAVVNVDCEMPSCFHMQAVGYDSIICICCADMP